MHLSQQWVRFCIPFFYCQPLGNEPGMERRKDAEDTTNALQHLDASDSLTQADTETVLAQRCNGDFAMDGDSDSVAASSGGCDSASAEGGGMPCEYKLPILTSDFYQVQEGGRKRRKRGRLW